MSVLGKMCLIRPILDPRVEFIHSWRVYSVKAQAPIFILHIHTVLWQMEHMHEMPALIIACMDFGQKADAAMVAAGNGSIWPGIQNLLLAARGLGLGSKHPPAARRRLSAREAA